MIDKIILGISRRVKKRPEIINLNGDELPKKCILIGNHNGAGGPFNYKTFVEPFVNGGAQGETPFRFMSWGAHQMCEGFLSRRRYLYHTFYRQKIGYSRVKSWFLSVFLGMLYPLVIHCAGIIPVYFDGRIVNTYKYSMQCLDKDVSVFVLPEDSNAGYKEKIEKMWPGFLQLARLAYKRYKTDLPIYTLRYERENPKRIIIGRPMFYQELAKNHTDEEILQIFTDYMNSLADITANGEAT